jgi:AraC-like DNA-binding protein
MTGIKPSFKEMVERAPPRPGLGCVVVQALGSLSPEDRVAAEAALADRRLSSAHIMRAFEAVLGRSPCENAIRNHRTGRHAGCPPSTTP